MNGPCTIHDPAPQFTKARYAKGKVAVTIPSNGTGTKTRAMRIASALPARWSNRERAYIMSPAAAKRLQTIYEAGKDASLGDVRGQLGFVIE